MLIDKYLPVYHFNEFHSIQLHGVFTDIYQTMLHCDLGNSFIKVLFRLRGLPSEVVTIERLGNAGFIKLHEEPGKEIIFGRMTTSPMFNNCQAIPSPGEFIQHCDPATIKAVINFKLGEINHSQHIISTETRVCCGSQAMKRRFMVYWFFIKPFSQLIRKSMLKQMKQQILRSGRGDILSQPGPPDDLPRPFTDE